MNTEIIIEQNPVVIRYDLVKDKKEIFLSMTSLTVAEFDILCNSFEEILNKNKPKDNKKGGRPPILKTAQDNLFFILFYLKTYQLQEVIGFLFGISQSQANYLIHFLSGILKDTLDKLDFMPKQISSELLEKLQSEGNQDLSIDGTERPINRPKDNDKQKKYYSGKKKDHTVKNIIIVGNSDNEIKYLSDTVEGSKHDKTIAEESQIILPTGTTIYQDKGFQGYEPEDANVIQPKKKPKKNELTSEEKESNRLISSVRVIAEHVISGIKRLHIVKDVFRNTKENYNNLVMWLACGLHNFRKFHRIYSY